MRRRTSSRSPRSPAQTGVHIGAVIAGDWHHYARYFAHELDVHFITSGGGGAFLHPTHVLKNAISVRWPEQRRGCERARAATGVRQGEGWKRKQYDIHLKRNTKAADVVDQAVQDVQDALEPLQAGHALAPSASASRSSRRRPSAIPRRARSYLLSLGNILFPFYNPASPSASACSTGSSPGSSRSSSPRTKSPSARSTSSASTRRSGRSWRFMPLYLVQAMIASISLVVMLGGLYAVLVWYVDAVDYPGSAPLPDEVLRRHQPFPGPSHRHVHALAVHRHAQQLDDPADRERCVKSIYEARQQQNEVVKNVIEESLTPLQRRTDEQQRSSGSVGRDRNPSPFARSSGSCRIRP